MWLAFNCFWETCFLFRLCWLFDDCLILFVCLLALICTLYCRPSPGDGWIIISWRLDSCQSLGMSLCLSWSRSFALGAPTFPTSLGSSSSPNTYAIGIHRCLSLESRAIFFGKRNHYLEDWRPSLLGWRPSLFLMEAIASINTL